MWDAWLDAYNTSRTPLPLVSNVGFEVRVPAPGRGTRRAAGVVQRIVAACLARLRGEPAADLGPRGEALSDAQWQLVSGGIREPRAQVDVFVPGRPDPEDREVVVLWRGRAHAVRVSDATGRPLPVDAVAAALDAVVGAPVDLAPPGPDFAAWSYLPNDDAAQVLRELLDDPRHGATNRATYDRLRDALLVVSLTDAGGDLPARMERVAFAPGQAFCVKPMTVQVPLHGHFTGLHLEHSTLDGSTLVAVLQAAQDADVPEHADPQNADREPAPPEALAWELTPALSARLTAGVEAYARDAARLRTRIERAPLPHLPATDFRLSLDALVQAAMLYAQLATYGTVRSTYESVDMRAYQGGRTECLRPNTRAAVDLARALVDGTATREHLLAHLDAHRAQVKRAKSGNAVDRHLFGLRLVATRDGLDTSLFDTAAFRALTTDFLSTTSLGESSRIVRAAFAPTSPGGIGIYYLVEGDTADFTVTTQDGAAQRVDEFAAALHEGVAAVWGLVVASAR